MGHYVEVVLVRSKREVGEHIDRLVDEGHADYCEEIRAFSVTRLNVEKLARWVAENAQSTNTKCKSYWRRLGGAVRST